MSIFSKSILTLCLLFSSVVLLHAQSRSDQRYLAGAVPEIDGKVAFTETIRTKHTADEITRMVEQWAENQKLTKDKYYDSKVIYNDTAKHEEVLLIDDRLIFSSTALSLDYALISYYLVVEAQNGVCELTIKSIKYKYAEDKDILTADNMISDEAALNKDKTKMYRKNNKFRIGTVDMVNNTFDEIEKYLNKNEYDAIKNAAQSRRGNNATKTVEAQTTSESQPVVTQEVPTTTAAVAPTIPVQVATPSTQTSTIETPTNRSISDTERKLIDLSKQPGFAMNNFFIVGENVAYVRQLSAISVSDADGKTSIICYVNNDGTMLQQSQIMPSGKFKILYYTPDSNSYNKLSDLSKKYAKGESYSDADINMIEVFIENSNNAFRCNRLKIETVSTNSIGNNSTIDGLSSVGKYIKTNKCVVITGDMID